jgi:hypothetical protein
MNALRGNVDLERLEIGTLGVHDDSFQALVAALPENRGLTHLRLTDCTVDDHCWEKLMGAIAGHPSLRTFSFEKSAMDMKVRSLNAIMRCIHLLVCLPKVNN